MKAAAAALCTLLAAFAAMAQEPRYDTAPVEIDGEALFTLRGVQALPAASRAAQAVERIEALARDRRFNPDQLRAVEREHLTDIVAGAAPVLTLTDGDAELESARRQTVAQAYIERIQRAIAEHREARTRASLIASTARSATALALAAALIALALWLFRRAEGALQARLQRHVEALATESRRILRVERLWEMLRGALGFVRIVVLFAVVLLFLEYVLVQFPWTRGMGLRLFDYVAGPLGNVGRGFVAQIPHLVFLVILFFATRYALSLSRLYFEAVARGSVQLAGFEPEWSRPTYNLLRVVIVAFALVVAYPYIPGSDSDAFKGISIFAGVVFSLGSTSAIANIIAGYMIIYRRAFRAGDRVKIGEVEGDVLEIGLQVTHVRTVKNEAITVPNSLILGSSVVNYSNPAREGRLIVHTEVGIGYETPWRQVEAMLVEAARRTPGVRAEPAPYVLQRKLGDFAVTYQINAYTDRAQGMQRLYADLHRNILDQFNEHGVQIMTPAYEGDPEKPKVVAKKDWFATPAIK